MKALRYDTKHNLKSHSPESEELPEDATVASQIEGDVGFNAYSSTGKEMWNTKLVNHILLISLSSNNDNLLIPSIYGKFLSVVIFSEHNWIISFFGKFNLYFP